MEENVQPLQVDESINTNQTVESPTSNSRSLLPYLLVVVIVAILAVALYFYNQTQVLKNQLTLVASPSPVAEPTSSPDPYENWNTYSNSVHNVSFKYPLGWQLTKEDDLAKFNASIKLAKDQATIHLIFGVDGIGGSGMNYEGTPFILDGNKVFKYKAHNTYDNSESLGITDTLKESLGVLMLDKKTYVINLKYPAKYIQSGENINLENTFDQILSSFKFNDTKITNVEEELKETVREYLSEKNMDLKYLKFSSIGKLGQHQDVYVINFTTLPPETNYGGEWIIVGKINSQWVAPDPEDKITCNWVNSAGFTEESDLAYYGQSCPQ